MWQGFVFYAETKKLKCVCVLLEKESWMRRCGVFLDNENNLRWWRGNVEFVSFLLTLLLLLNCRFSTDMVNRY